MAAPRCRLAAALLAAVALVAVVVSACLTSSAGQSSQALASPGTGHQGTQHAVDAVNPVDGPAGAGQQPDAPLPLEPAAADGPCPDQAPPVPACHNQADLQLTTPAAGPRPDADLRWDHPRYAAERAGLAGSPVPAPAPDLIALSISRT
ncbi:hypothetical protein NCCP1664_21160 [Zafaria cholistanensis]|uniref:Uncharacterized protein n=1 Tax=Zafaria cholistanensis TaxID=1682741 RepID=A0A5A7NUT4_9MICC|nr:hypothetical protein [Zafaria cholistanensis]GER23621.1 hypothetical protein NCCP1664_21160 [Zafaria cholistanensis]